MTRDLGILDALPDLDLRDIVSKKKYLSKLYFNYLKSHKVKAILLSLLTGGFYLFLLKITIKKRFFRQLSAKKIFSYQMLSEKIENIRKGIDFTNPKAGIKKIYKIITADDESSALCKLYSKSELLLFISCPFEEDILFHIFQKDYKKRNFTKDWIYIKQSARSDEIDCIKKINQHYGVLKNRFLLTKSDVNIRLSRSVFSKDAPHSLTLLRVVNKAFEELVLSYEEYSSHKKSNFSSFEMLSMVMNIHLEETLDLLSFFNQEKKVYDLSLSTQRLLIDFYAKACTLEDDNLQKLRQKNTLIFTEAQESLFHKLLDSIDSISTIVDPILESFYKKMKPNSEMFLNIFENSEKFKPSEEKQLFIEKLPKEHSDFVTENFLLGLNTQGIQLDLISNSEIKSIDASDSMSEDFLHSMFQNFYEFSNQDFELLKLLQEVTSLKGRKDILHFIQESVKSHLGQSSFINEIKLSKIRIEKIDKNTIEIGYNIFRNLPDNTTEITQSLEKSEGKWIPISHETH